jgi:hypothetical protein
MKNLVTIAFLALALCGCASSREVRLAPAADRGSRTPVVLIPGITGTELRDAESRKVAWGKSRHLFFPRDGGYALALPVTEPAVARPLEPGDAILRIRLLGVYTRPIYAPILRLMKEAGYTPGDLDDPRPGDDFFFFPYDWRKSSPEAAARLADRLERLRRARGDDTLEVTLVCQSNAALVARYLAKYGTASLDEAAEGTTAPLRGVRIDKLILVGTANGGSLRTLNEIHHGRNYVRWVGRAWKPETLFTMPALYESLPAHRDDLLVDADGATSRVDIFDAATWERFGWSIYRPDVRRRLERPDRQQRFGDPAERRVYLQRQLDRARTLHEVLQRDPEGYAPPRFYSLQDLSRPSPARLMPVERDGRTTTAFPEDAELRKDPFLASIANAPGDGHATMVSQGWLSPAERDALARPTVYVPAGGHFEIILEPAAKRHLLDFLADGRGASD